MPRSGISINRLSSNPAAARPNPFCTILARPQAQLALGWCGDVASQ